MLLVVRLKTLAVAIGVLCANTQNKTTSSSLTIFLWDCLFFDPLKLNTMLINEAL